MLILPEQWIILALDGDSGKLKLPRSVFECGITGGILFELWFAGRNGLTEGKKIQVKDSTQTDNPLLDTSLRLMNKAKKPQTVLKWMANLTMQDSRVIESFFFRQMIEQNILEKKSRKILGFINSRRYFPVSRRVQNQILGSLEKSIQVKPSKEIRTLCLLGLVSHCGYADRLLGTEQGTLLSKNSLTIFSDLENKDFPPGFIPFIYSVLEALTLSQQSAGAY